MQWFRMPYQAIPTFTQQIGYAEVQRSLSPRWYVAGRAGFSRASAIPGSESYELATGYRPAAQQLLKLSYSIQRGTLYPGAGGNTLSAEFVTSFRALSRSGR
jgi:hypothetical protein